MRNIPDDIFTPPAKGHADEHRILILTDDKVEDLEFYYPFYRFIEEGYTVDVVTPDGGTFKGKTGYKFEQALAIAEVNAEDYDLLYIPGGKAPASLKKNDDALTLVKNFAATGKPIASICHGPQVLAAAGVIDGMRLAAWPEVADEVEEAGARFVNQETMIDGQFITGRWPADLPAHLRETLGVLNRHIATDPLARAHSRRNIAYWPEQRNAPARTRSRPA